MINIVSVGWQCADFLMWTLKSVEMQESDDWRICVVYDKSSDGGEKLIRNWCRKDPKRRLFRFNKDRKYAPRNQYEAVHEILKPKPDDIVLFLDLDGDKLSHPHVLDVIAQAYKEGALCTYGQYRPVPPNPKHKVGMAREWPPEVVANNSYRAYTQRHGTCFNHPRTAAAKIFYSIPEEYFKWPDGTWIKGATDYIVMLAALERANGRHKFIPEILLDYNMISPHPDNMNKYDEGWAGHDATLEVLLRPPLLPFEERADDAHSSPLETPVPKRTVKAPIYGRDAPGSTDIYLSADQRREIIRAYGKAYELNILIETGTNDGGTPLYLKDDFRDIYTIELSRELWKEAVQRLGHYAHIRCLLGDSARVLGDLLFTIQEPALFWLDAHYSGGVTARGDLDTAIVQELQIILADSRPHVVLVDDARIFGGGEEHDMYDHYQDYPSQTWVKEFANAHGYDYLLDDDIFRLTPRFIDETL